jgi:Zn-dependent protease
MRDYNRDYDYDYYERPAYDDRPSYETRKVYVIGRPREPELFPRRSGKFSTSGTEMAHLTIAYIILVICFAVVFTFGLGGIMSGFILPEFFMSRFAIMFPISLVAVALGFILHEMAHKLSAQRYGHWSEFRYDGRGLLMALVFSVLIGIVYAAPGATWISGNVTKRENGIISIAGPSVNIITAVLFLPFTLILFYSANAWYYPPALIGFIVSFLALFNMLPFYPLDGSKIWAWNKGIYIGAFAISIGLVGFYWVAAWYPWLLL